MAKIFKLSDYSATNPVPVELQRAALAVQQLTTELAEMTEIAERFEFYVESLESENSWMHKEMLRLERLLAAAKKKAKPCKPKKKGKK